MDTRRVEESRRNDFEDQTLRHCTPRPTVVGLRGKERICSTTRNLDILYYSFFGFVFVFVFVS